MREKKSAKQNNKLFSIQGIDLTIVFVALILSVFCLVFVYSATAFETQKSSRFLLWIMTDSEKTLFKSLGFILVGVVVMFAIAIFNFQKFENSRIKAFRVIYYILAKNPTLYYVASCGFFIFIEIMKHVGSDSAEEDAVIGLGTIRKANGAYRWINVIPKTSISYQPSEVIKLLLIIAFAIIIFRSGMMLKNKRGIIIYMAMAALPAFFVFKFSSDLSSSIVVFSILVTMMIVAGSDIKSTFIILLIVFAIGFTVMIGLIAFNKGKPESDIHPYQAKRILAWIYPDDYPATSDQTTQAMYAIGSGGFFGKGIGNSMQKIKKLPEAQNDMIFALICEELGLFGGIVVLALYFTMLMRMYFIALESRNLFDRMIVVGVMAHIALQVIINVCVVTRLFPNTGLPLPLISAGGSSIVFMFIELGLVLNIGKKVES